MKRALLISGMALTILSACKKDNEGVVPITTVIGTKTISVPFSSVGTFTLFRFSDSSIVANTDSSSNKWDFGLRRTTFIVNKASSGPGEAGVILQDGVFDQITSAPTVGYAYDTSASQKAIKSYTSWATYSGPPNNSFIPIAGKVFLFKTGDGSHYAKMELLSVDYAPFTGPNPTTLLYKFRYAYQANGTVTF